MKSFHIDLRRLYVYVTLISCVFLSKHVRGLPALGGEAAAASTVEEGNHDNRNFVLGNNHFNSQLRIPDGKEHSLWEPKETDDDNDEAEDEGDEEVDQRERMEMNEEEGHSEEKYVGGQELGDEEKHDLLNEESKVSEAGEDDNVQTLSDTHAKEEDLLPHTAQEQNNKQVSDTNQKSFNFDAANRMDIKDKGPSVREDQEPKMDKVNQQALDINQPQTKSGSVVGQPPETQKPDESIDFKQGIPFKLEEGNIGNAESRFQFGQNLNGDLNKEHDVNQHVSNPVDANQNKGDVEPQESQTRPAAGLPQNVPKSFGMNFFPSSQNQGYKPLDSELKTPEKTNASSGQGFQTQNKFNNQPPVNNLPPVVEGNQGQTQGIPAGRGRFDPQQFADLFKPNNQNFNNFKKQEPVADSNLQDSNLNPVPINPSQNGVPLSQNAIVQPPIAGQPGVVGEGQPPQNQGGVAQPYSVGQSGVDRANQPPLNLGGVAHPSTVGQSGVDGGGQPPLSPGGVFQPFGVRQPGVDGAAQPPVNQGAQDFQADQNRFLNQDLKPAVEDKDGSRTVIDEDTQALLNQNQDFQLDNEQKHPLNVNENQGPSSDFIKDDNQQIDDIDEGGQKQSQEQPDDGGHKQSEQYSEDGYLDAPADNLDIDKAGLENGEGGKSDTDYVDESDQKNFDENDQYGENNNNNLNNQNIIDDNNEQAAYNGDQRAAVDNQDEEGKADDYDYDNDNDVDDDDYTLDQKNDHHDEDEKPETTTEADDWYNDQNDDDADDDDDDDDDDEIDDTKTDDYMDEEEEDMDFKVADRKPDNTFYYNNRKPVFKEGVVEYKMNNHSSMNTPSSMVLFYTWIILVVLIAVVTLSAFRYRCKGMFSSRTLRNGRNGRNGDENKRLLDNVYA